MKHTSNGRLIVVAVGTLPDDYQFIYIFVLDSDAEAEHGLKCYQDTVTFLMEGVRSTIPPLTHAKNTVKGGATVVAANDPSAMYTEYKPSSGTDLPIAPSWDKLAEPVTVGSDVKLFESAMSSAVEKKKIEEDVSRGS